MQVGQIGLFFMTSEVKKLAKKHSIAREGSKLPIPRVPWHPLSAKGAR